MSVEFRQGRGQASKRGCRRNMVASNGNKNNKSDAHTKCKCREQAGQDTGLGPTAAAAAAYYNNCNNNNSNYNNSSAYNNSSSNFGNGNSSKFHAKLKCNQRRCEQLPLLPQPPPPPLPLTLSHPHCRSLSLTLGSPTRLLSFWAHRKDNALGSIGLE